jgi:hypothetical protein
VHVWADGGVYLGVQCQGMESWVKEARTIERGGKPRGPGLASTCTLARAGHGARVAAADCDVSQPTSMPVVGVLGRDVVCIPSSTLLRARGALSAYHARRTWGGHHAPSAAAATGPGARGAEGALEVCDRLRLRHQARGAGIHAGGGGICGRECQGERVPGKGVTAVRW